MAAVTVTGLSKRFAGAAQPALSALDLEVKDGELLVLVGPSGCGKSTALRIVAGLEQATGGTVMVDGVDVTAMPPQDRDIAMVFQSYALYPHLTVGENMAFPLKMRGMAKAERRKKVSEIAQLVGLSDKLSRRPAELSGGERQRVAMGRAIVRQPKVFLFDEPLSNLDAKLRSELRVELAALVRRLGVTSIYVTHDQAEAMTMGDRVAVLEGGRLQQVASPRDVYEKPANMFVASFVGTPAMNLLALECEHGEAKAEGVQLLRCGDVSGAVKVGFRPEHVVVGAAQADGELMIEGEVAAVESLGPETWLHMTIGTGVVRARVPGFGDFERGSRVSASVRREHLLLFDACSGASLDAGQGRED